MNIKKLLLTVAIATTSFAAISQNNYGITTIAGTGGYGGYAGDNNPNAQVLLTSPAGIVIDASGNIYFSDESNNCIRKKSSASGKVSTIAGLGGGFGGYSGDGGPAVFAELYHPAGLAVKGTDLFIADAGNNCIRKLNLSTGIITTVAGTGGTSGYSGDGADATLAELYDPTGVAVDASGNLYIADNSNNVIRKVTASTGFISTIAGTGTAAYSGDGAAATAAELSAPQSVTLDGAGDIFIADAGNNVIREITVSSGNISTVAGDGSPAYSGDGGPATAAQLTTPYHVAFSGTNMIISDYGNSVMRVVAGSTGNITTIAGIGTTGFSGDNGPAPTAELYNPYSAAVGANGNVYISDYNNYCIRKITLSSGNITTDIGLGGTSGFAGDIGYATQAQFYNPYGVAFDAANNIYIADAYNNRVRKINASTGIIACIAGTGTPGYGGDGDSATLADLDEPYAVAVDANGNVFIADYNNHCIRKISGVASGTIVAGTITTIAGTGVMGDSGNGGPAVLAELNGPTGLALDGNGNLYIADSGNNRIKKIFAAASGTIQAGTIVVVAGNGNAGYTLGTGGGIATTAELNGPTGVAVDASGNIYIADNQNHCIRKVNATTTKISTIAGHIISGSPIPGYGGSNVAALGAELFFPSGVAVDGTGNVYIVDKFNNVIKKITISNNKVYSVGGNYNKGQGFSGDGGPADSAQLDAPYGIAVTSGGDVIFSDAGNNRIRKLTMILAVEDNATDDMSDANLYPNPAVNEVNFVIDPKTGYRTNGVISVYDLSGQMVKRMNSLELRTIINTSDLADGIYVCELRTADNNVVRKKLMVQH